MNKKLAAFDIEIAEDIPEGVKDWKEIRPLGITCAAIMLEDEPNDPIWFYRRQPIITATTPQVFADRMSRQDCAYLLEYLQGLELDGYTLTTWNGLGFDFDVLGEEADRPAHAAALALRHYDPMFQFFCENGFPVGLEAVSQGFRMEGKTEGMSGALAPEMWRDGQQEKVLEYVAQDCVVNLNIARAIIDSQEVKWITKKGRLGRKPAWKPLTVTECLELPEPDNSWMSDPIPRSQFTGWTTDALALEQNAPNTLDLTPA